MVKFRFELGNVLDAQARFGATGDAEVTFSAVRGVLDFANGAQLALKAADSAVTFFDGKQAEAAELRLGEDAVHLVRFAVWLPRRTMTHLLNALTVPHRRLEVVGDLLGGRTLPGRRARYDTILLRSVSSARTESGASALSLVRSDAGPEFGRPGDQNPTPPAGPDKSP